MGLRTWVNRLALALKAFVKAFKEPELALQFLAGASSSKKSETADPSHLRLLHYFQQSGRLIDFLKEDISAFTDSQVGAAVRKIHLDCAGVLEELVTVRPLKEEPEGSLVQVPKGYNPIEIKVVGKVKGDPPYSGILVHRGWKAHKRSLPKIVSEQAPDVICPAEIEFKGG